MKVVYIVHALFLFCRSVVCWCRSSAPPAGEVLLFYSFPLLCRRSSLFHDSKWHLQSSCSQHHEFTAPKEAYIINNDTALCSDRACFPSGSQLCVVLSEKAAGLCIKEACGGVYYMSSGKGVCVSGFESASESRGTAHIYRSAEAFTDKTKACWLLMCYIL